MLVVLASSRSYALTVLLHPFHPTDWSHNPQDFRHELRVHSSGSVRVAQLQDLFGPFRSSTRSRYEPPVDLTGQKGAYTPDNQRQDVGGGIDEFGTGVAHTTRRQRKEDALEEDREKRGEWDGEDVYEGIDPVFNRIVDWDTKGAEADLLAQADPGFLFENTEDREAREAAERERAEVDQEEAEETATAKAIHQEQSQGLSQTAVVENEGTC